MQALILAAGMGKRLGKHTRGHTKCMVQVGGRTLLESALDALVEAGVSRAILVIGHHGDEVRQFIGDRYRGMPILYRENKDYATTNNIYSLWLAEDLMGEDDTLLLESDLIFEGCLIRRVVDDPAQDLAVVAKLEPWMDGTVTLLDEEAHIASFIPREEIVWGQLEHYYKTVNIYKLSKNFFNRYYRPFLDAYIQAIGKSAYYELVLSLLSNINAVKFKALRTRGEKWYEIDTVADLDIANALFAEKQEKVTNYQNRYGGYWRFSSVRDFCYLVNPYFPPERLYAELGVNLKTLTANYPSGLNVQNLLASSLFNCDASQILVGNGASELIKLLLEVLEGRIGVVYPTFNEYPRRIGKEREGRFVVLDADFRYSLEDLKALADDAHWLLLINPDNPSGHFFQRAEVIELLDYLKERDVGLIFDESFGDFVDGDERFTLLQDDILAGYPNLFVVKSISKSYGVPGLRLGVLAGSNREVMDRIQDLLPIWNINSYGENFLQIFGKYRVEYRHACDRISAERARFFQRLSKIGFLRVIPSQANYFLCEVTGKYTAGELTEVLLVEYDVLIKDCTGKIGFEGGHYIRLSIRNRADNDYLVEKLQELS
ncbi:MAG: aminotransferase class I/II-fold pyridoxal phosphate-dependent enzyme [Gammaproteobacteria bacterium]|nr:aminotransferase class I/II-fold pyridoxal phosphate-dependent enzyme [Gammaproteobacteria bacterium]